MKKESSNKLGMKDVIVVSVLGVVCLAIRFLFMILGGILPVAWFASHAIDALLMGPVFMLVVAKTRRNGPIFIISTIIGIVFIVASTSILVSEILIGGILAEVALLIGKFRSKLWILISYIFFSFGFIGDFYQLWFNKDAFLEYSEAFMNADYLNALSAMVSTPTIIVILISILIGSIIGGLFGFKLMRKHFVKAGIVQ